MIRAVFWKNPQKHIIKFSINGHANYGENGCDIVCAAVSSLAIGIVNGLTEIIGIPVDCIVDDGDMLVQIPANLSDKDNEFTQILLRTLHLGISELKAEYPDNIKLKLITLTNLGGEQDA